jgi:hypothetical protein
MKRLTKQERIQRAIDRLFELEHKHPAELTEKEKLEMLKLKEQYG